MQNDNLGLEVVPASPLKVKHLRNHYARQV